MVGDPTEAALVVAARKAGIALGNRRQAILKDLPFDSDRQMMSVLAAPQTPLPAILYTKGSVERVLACFEASSPISLLLQKPPQLFFDGGWAVPKVAAPLPIQRLRQDARQCLTSRLGGRLL